MKKCFGFLWLTAVIVLLAQPALAEPVIEKFKWQSAGKCNYSVMIETRQRVGKNARYIDEPELIFYSENIELACMRGTEVSTDLRYAFLYHIEKNYPAKVKYLKNRLSASSQTFRIVEDEERLSQMRNAYSKYAKNKNGVQVINVTDFTYQPGVYWDRSDRKKEHARILETYHSRDNQIEY